MQLVSIAHDRITVELDPQDCFHLARACEAAGYDLAGSTIPDRFFGVEAGTTASLGLSACYQALAVAFLVGAYAGESSYFLPDTDRERLGLDYLARRYGGGTGSTSSLGAGASGSPPRE